MIEFAQIVAQSDDVAEVKLYGTITEWGKVNADDLRDTINKASKSAKQINLRVNSPGGSIFEGIAMHTAVKSAKVPVYAYIDGLAASMASVFIMAAEKVYMVRHTRMMLHSGSGGVRGQVKDLRKGADLLESFNATMAEIYAEKTGKDPQWIKSNWMQDGDNTWFTADQALEAGLVDEVVDGKVQPPPREDEANAHFERLAAHYNNQLQTTSTISNETAMKEIAKALNLPENSTQEQIIYAINNLNANSGNQEFAVKALRALAETKGMDADKMENLARADFETTLAYVQEYQAPSGQASGEGSGASGANGQNGQGNGNGQNGSGQGTGQASGQASDQSSGQGNGTADDGYRLGKFIEDLKKQGQGGSGKANDRSDWTLKDWEQKDPKGLQKMMSEDREKYKSLFKAEFGEEPDFSLVDKVT